MKTSPRRILEGSLLTFGLLGIGIALWSVGSELIYERRSNQTFDERSPGSVAPSSHTYSNGDLIGRLIIPRLGLKGIVREGTGATVLSLSLGHIAGTASPGENGNVGVAGHRDSLFRGLRDIRESDQIIFETAQGDRYTYRVENMRIVKPTEVEVLRAGLYPELTLVTCYPFRYIGPAPSRYIVKARQVGQTTRVPSDEVSETPPPRSSLSGGGSDSPGTPSGKDSHKVSLVQKALIEHKQLAPGGSIGLTHGDPERKSIDGWIWLSAERRTVWLRDQHAGSPIAIRDADGVPESRDRALMYNAVRGYLASSSSIH